MLASLQSRFATYAARLSVASVLSVGLLMTPATISGAAGPDHPLPPAGYQGDESPPPGATLTTEIITLPPAQCAEMNNALAAAGHEADADCRAIHKSYARNHLPLPAGTITGASRGLFSGGTAVASSAYWHWSNMSYECAIYGCWYWQVKLTYDGVANGDHVWAWNVGCTATGYNTTCGWTGYLYNGGGWPHYGVQFGENSTSCAAFAGGPACFGHGQRQWVDDWGDPFGYYAW